MLGTIGYERSTLADFVATLQLANVHTLVDVRERAQSRRPGFSKRALEAALDEVGIQYVHFPELGDPKPGREAARAGNMSLFREIYTTAMAQPKAQAALTKIEELAMTERICLMCFERNYNDCHRKIVADNLQKRLGVKASHLGVAAGAANDSAKRRVLYTHQGATASI